MKLPRFVWLLLSCGPLVSGWAVERLPIEDFARTPDLSRVRLSLDGRQVAYLGDHNGLTKLHVLDLDTKQTVRLNLGEEKLMNGYRKEVGSFEWVGGRRLVLSTLANDFNYGVIGVNSDGSREVGISGFENVAAIRLEGDYRVPASWAREVIHAYDDKTAGVLMLERHENSVGSFNRPDIIKVDTFTGASKVVVKNPGEVAAWGVDFDGVAKIGILSHGDLSGMIYRPTEKAAWETVLPLKDRRGSMRPLRLDASGEKAFVAALTPEKRWGLYALDVKTGQVGEPLLSDAVYDIVPATFTPSIDGVPLAGPIFSEAKKRLIGVRYYTDAARVKWFDQDFITYQKAIDRSLPDTVNLLVDQSTDGKQLLWFSYSDQNPGSYSLLDTDRKSFKPIASRMSWLKPAAMAQMLAVKYQARDGLLIHGYLTVPVGHQPKDLPLVVMPHGGPWVRDVWEFDPLVQLLANRGYAVLQMNYRGSAGYGEELSQNAKRQIGGKIQEDIEDGTRWAIAAGVADPKRIAIYGMSYGGYSALFALGKTPDLYRCGISNAGVTDWYAIYRQSDVADYKQSSKYWREQIGDPSKDEHMLKAISPVYFADKIVVPTLIIQGKSDQRVPLIQAKAMVTALEKAGRKPETLFLNGVGHNYGQQKDRIEIYRTIVAFLEKNLGPGVD